MTDAPATEESPIKQALTAIQAQSYVDHLERELHAALARAIIAETKLTQALQALDTAPTDE